MEAVQQAGEVRSLGTEQRSKVWTPLAWGALALAVTPLFELGIFLVLVAWARVQNGRWPQFGDPDPHLFGHDILLLGSLGLVFFWVYPILALGVLLLGRWRERDFPIKTVLVCGLVASGIVWAYYVHDPGHFLNWLFD